jgi:hypothetical protein
VALIGALVLPAAVTIRPFLFTYSPQEAVSKIYPLEGFDVMQAVGRRVAQLAGPDDRIFIHGSEPEVLFYARRVSATRYIILFPLYGPYRNVHEKQVAAAEEVARANPAVVVYFPNGFLHLLGTEDYFTLWSKAYLERGFRTDSCLILDEAMNAHFNLLASGRKSPVADGEILIGAVFRRKPAAP